jgi:hypothetical protein
LVPHDPNVPPLLATVTSPVYVNSGVGIVVPGTLIVPLLCVVSVGEAWQSEHCCPPPVEVERCAVCEPVVRLAESVPWHSVQLLSPLIEVPQV